MNKDLIIEFAGELDTEDCLMFDPFMDKDRISEWLEKKIIIIAKENDKIIGYLRFMYFWRNLPYICLIKVSKNRRNQGIGKAMVLYLENFLKQKGFNKLLSSTDADEAEPQNWHKKVGFEEAGFIREINESGIGEIFFLKRI
ncbi:MAG: GNAT family N-acetyltransferase [Bacteroidetes bacterium]|nr:MAG: GNAT family N-acetyltransferase [Bacteroidota bacterium]